MTATFRLGRIAGIEIGAHWSWLLVWRWSSGRSPTGVFPDTNPGLADGTYLAMAIVATLLFFASILLHELGHAVQAQREGIAIEGITLWVFGGVASLKQECSLPPAPELRVVLARPAGLARARRRLLLLAALASAAARRGRRGPCSGWGRSTSTCSSST